MPVPLKTAEDVIARAGVRTLPEYENIAPMLDSAGFYAYRRYPANCALANILTNDGRPAVRCYLRSSLCPPQAEFPGLSFALGYPAGGEKVGCSLRIANSIKRRLGIRTHPLRSVRPFL